MDQPQWPPPTPGPNDGQSASAANADDDGPACLSCRKRKLRCSREHPTCTHCLRLGTDCAYDTKKGKPGIKAGVIETLTKRIDALEEALRGGNPSKDGAASTCSGHGNETRAIYDILAFFAEEFKKSNSARQSTASPHDGAFVEPATSSPSSSFSWRQNPLELYGSNATSNPENPRKRKRVDSCGNPNLPLDISPEELETLSDQLPSPALMDAIISVYFITIQPWIPILHETRFRTNLNDATQRPRLVVILHAMVVAALRFVADSELSPEEIDQRCRRSRNIVVLTAMESLAVENLQALIIIAFNDIGSGYASRAWPIVGSLTRTVEYLQLTVEDEEHPRHSLLKPLFSLEKAGNWTEIEERRRVFWNIFNMDRFCSVTTGWNTSLTADDVHRRLPADGGLWHKEETVVTPYFNIWDKSAAKIKNSIAFLPAHYPPTRPPNGGPVAHQSRESRGNGPSEEAVDMSTVGAFAYCIEATESLSRVTTYFLQQKVDLRDRQEVSTWLTRFKELDLRLVHWKLFLPQKWKDSNISREPARINMDPNLTLAHLTHNTSMILLHQKIAYPSRDWTDIVKLPSFCSAETCQNAAIEICTITQKYLKYTPTNSIVNSQFAFCAFVSARVLLVHWRHYDAELLTEFWTLLESLEEMSKRWGGKLSGSAICVEDLASKYAQQLRGLHQRITNDLNFRVDVLGYSNEVPLQPTPSNMHRSHSTQDSTPASLKDATSTPGKSVNGNPSPIAKPGGGGGSGFQNFPYSPSQGQTATTPSTVSHVISPRSVPLPDGTSDELTAISHTLLGQQFLELDRVISFDNTMFAVNMLGQMGSNGWDGSSVSGSYGI